MTDHEAKRIVNPIGAEPLEGWETKSLGVFRGDLSKEWATNAVEIDATKFVIEHGSYEHDNFRWIPGADTAYFQDLYDPPAFEIVWTVREVHGGVHITIEGSSLEDLAERMKAILEESEA